MRIYNVFMHQQFIFLLVTILLVCGQGLIESNMR